MTDSSDEIRSDPDDPASRETLARNPDKDFLPPPPGEPPSEPLPRRHGKYTLIEELGRGGMGKVYRARDRDMNRDVAIKFFRQSWDESQIRRFRVEVETLARLHHGHIVSIYESGEEDGKHFFCMEYVRGKTFRVMIDEMIAEDRCDVGAICQVIADIAFGLHHAHENGVIHRDVKPQNIMVAEDNQAKLLDFGLAKDVGGPTLSQTGSVLGTPYYMSPEQVAGKKITVDPRTDVYSLGIVLYEALTFKIPFDGETTHQVYRQILMKDPVNPRQCNPRLAPDLVTITMKAIEKDPEKRYSTCRELGEDLLRFLSFETIQARPASLPDQLIKRARRNPVASTAVGILSVISLILLGILLVTSHLERQGFRDRLDEAAALLDKGELNSSMAALRRLQGVQPTNDELTQLVRRCEAAIFERRTRQNSRKSEDLFQQALESLEHHQKANLDIKTLKSKVDKLRKQTDSYLPLALQQELVEIEDAISEKQQNAWISIEEAILNLSASLKHNSDQDVARKKLLDLAIQLYRQAKSDHDLRQSTRFRSLFESEVTSIVDDEERNEYERRFAGLSSIDITTDPIGATVYLFRYRNKDRRLVPVPFHPERDEEPGFDERPEIQGPFRFVEVVSLIENGMEWNAGLRPQDKIVFLDGRIAYDPDAAHRLLTEDGVEEVVLCRQGNFEVLSWILDSESSSRSGLELEYRTNDAYPLFCTPFNQLGSTPLRVADLKGGSYLLLLRREGFADVRYPLFVRPETEEEVSVQLLRSSEIPPGFIRIPAGPYYRGADPKAASPQVRDRIHVEDFFIGQIEVTFEEYLEFVNDLALTDRGAIARHSPRYAPREGHLMSTRGRRVVLRNDFPPGTPAFCISWEDARAYCRWMNDKAIAEEKDYPWEFALPTEDEWAKAARGADERAYVWGEQFAPSFCSASASERLEDWRPGGLFPHDVSPFGVWDMAGGVCEFSGHWFDPDQETRPIRGGSWGLASEIDFRIGSRGGTEAHLVSPSFGIRLVCHRRD